ncbi:MAG: class I SAM-dependent methyltransferase, partial [Gammaproteobacteria bacterium]
PRQNVLSHVPRDARTLLDVGCNTGAFGEALKQERPGICVWGVEPIEGAAEIAATRYDHVVTGSYPDALAAADAQFDCIVFNDVLEHLVDPESALKKAGELLRPGGAVVASIPNMRYLPVLRDLVTRAEWRYSSEGVLDRTHLRFFTHKSIAEMFTESGYRIVTLEGINARPTSWKFRALNLVTSNAFADLRYLQFAIVATRVDPLDCSDRPMG